MPAVIVASLVVAQFCALSSAQVRIGRELVIALRLRLAFSLVNFSATQIGVCLWPSCASA
jgi:hypothetical protein